MTYTAADAAYNEQTYRPWHKDALARIANTFGVLGDQDYGTALREFASQALHCQSSEEYAALLEREPD